MNYVPAFLHAPSRMSLMQLCLLTLLSIFTLAGLSSTPTAAQDTPQATSETNSQETTKISDLTKRLDKIEKALTLKNISSEGLIDLGDEIVDIKTKASQLESLLAPKAAEAKARLDALSPVEQKAKAEPKADSKEPTKTADPAQPQDNDGAEAASQSEATQEEQQLQTQRDSLNKAYANLQSQLTLIRASIVRADLLQNRITLFLQDRFTSELLERSGTILNPILWARGLSGIGTLWDSALFQASDWMSFLSNKAGDKIWEVFGMIVLVALLIIGPLRYLLFSGITRLARLEHPTPLQRSSHALWSTFVYTFVPFAILVGGIIILENASLLPLRIQQIAELLLVVVFLSALSYGTLRALLAPQKPAYRLVSYRTPRAAKLFGIGLLLITTYVVQSTISALGEVLIGRLETTIMIRGASSIVTAILVWIALKLVVGATARTDATQATNEQDYQNSSFALPAFLLWLRPLVWLSCIVIIAAPILGYVSLGFFLSEQLLRIFLTLGLLGILTGFIDNFLLENIDPNTDRVRKLAASMGLKAKTLGQMSVLFNGALRILLYCATALLIFAPWGLRSTDFFTSIKTGALQLQFGDLQISPVGILGSILVFIVALVLVKGVQRWMEKRLLPSTNLDTGLKNSIQTSVGYVGFIIAAMLAFSYLGIDLSNLALVAGALSVGIGFGLQSIVNNFVSGLILLVERPIKTGDWVVVGADQGYVKKISVRATKIETFDRATVIVPNSDLISNRVMNWMHNGSMGRIIIPVGVSYDADPEQVREILLKIAEESEHIASYPAPTVYFMDFGASSLDFQLRCYIQNIDNSLSAKSALRFAIFKALKDAKIEIPFPQQDIHVRSITTEDDELEIIQPKRPTKAAKTKHEMTSDEADLEGDADGTY